MGKVLVPALAVVFVGVLAWFLMREPGGEEKGTAVAPGSSAPSDTKKAPATEELAAPATQAAPRVVHGALAVRPPMPALADNAPGEAVEAAVAPVVEPVEVMPSAPLDEVKETVRAYFGNLPRSGKMPAKVTLDEVLPRAVIEKLGARADAPIVMLGHRQISEKEAYTDILEMTDAYQQVMGVSWREPDGTERRQYVQLTVPEKPE